MEKFGMDWKDDDGSLIEVLYWMTNGRFFRKVRENGVVKKAKRISESDYISAYETYKNN